MNKNKRTPVLLIIILLISVVAVIILFSTLIFCSSCFPSGVLGEQQNAPVSGGAGLGPINLSDESPVYISFEKAFTSLGETSGLARDHESRLQIYYIRGQNVDDNGWAAQWLFEAKSEGGSELRVFDRHGWTVIPWNVTHTAEIISVETILSPSGLFNQSRPAIAEKLASSAASGREIELSGNVYTLTVTSANATDIMRFDATTGALIP